MADIGNEIAPELVDELSLGNILESAEHHGFGADGDRRDRHQIIVGAWCLENFVSDLLPGAALKRPLDRRQQSWLAQPDCMIPPDLFSAEKSDGVLISSRDPPLRINKHERQWNGA